MKVVQANTVVTPTVVDHEEQNIEKVTNDFEILREGEWVSISVANIKKGDIIKSSDGELWRAEADPMMMDDRFVVMSTPFPPPPPKKLTWNVSASVDEEMPGQSTE